MENRRGQGRESSEGQSESEDCGELVGSRDRDMSGAAVAAKAAVAVAVAAKASVAVNVALSGSDAP